MKKTYVNGPRSIKWSDKIGLPPGTLIYTGKRKREEEKITIIDYDENIIQSKEFKKLEKNLSKIADGIVRWINIEGLGQLDVIEDLGREFHLHPLLLEDIVNSEHRPKVENYEDYLFIILKHVWWNDEKNQFLTEQISIVLGKDYVITFKEGLNSLFMPIIDMLTHGKGRIRKMGADYLAYSLIDAIIDYYFEIIDKLGLKIDEIEEYLITNPVTKTLQSIRSLEREILTLIRSAWASRNVINNLQREDFFSDKTIQLYLRDAYDHIIQIADNFENFREIIEGLIDIYLSSVNNKMNEVIKVLTIISTIFIPLSFLVGFYGMNFQNMPEYSFPFAYPLIIIVMFAISLLMILYFKRKKWL